MERDDLRQRRCIYLAAKHSNFRILDKQHHSSRERLPSYTLILIPVMDDVFFKLALMMRTKLNEKKYKKGSKIVNKKLRRKCRIV